MGILLSCKIMAVKRKLLVAVNILFLLGGLGIAAMGGVALSNQNMGFSVVDKHLGIALCAVGGVIVLVALLGMCGVGLRSPFILRVYFCLIFLAVLAEIFIVVFSITQRAQMEHLLSKGWRNSGDGMRADFQKKEHCCGFDSPTSPSSTVCAACPDLTKCALPGCKDALESEVKKNLLVIIIAGSIVGFLQILGLILACCVIRSRKRETRANWDHGRPLLGTTSAGSINATDSSFPRAVVSSSTLVDSSSRSSHAYVPSPYQDGIDSGFSDSHRAAPPAPAWKPKSTAEMIAELRAEKEAERQRAVKDSSPDF